jgi:hypothetical protein
MALTYVPVIAENVNVTFSDVKVNGTLEVDGATTLNGTLNAGNTSIGGTLTTTGNATFPTMSVTGSSSMGDIFATAVDVNTLAVTPPTAAIGVITVQPTGDTQSRYQVLGTGDVKWGSGSAAADTTLNRPSTAQLRITPSANASSSSSVGGALNITNTASTGAGVVVYSEQAAPAGHLIVSRANNAAFNQAAIFTDYVGTSHAVSVNHKGTGAASSALNLASTNVDHSCLGISGVESGRGTIKVTHTNTGAAGSDASASALSIDLTGTGTASQGIFLTSTTGGTTGNLIEARNGGTGAVFNVSSTGVVGLGSGTNPPDTNLYRSAANLLKTDDKFTAVGGIGVGNSVAAAALGTVVRKMEVFDASGNSIGFVPVYDAIT